MNISEPGDKGLPYGQVDATFRAAGGEAGVRQLVACFYERMEFDDRFQVLWQMHPKDNVTSRDKLSRFLMAWMGGPRTYQQHYGGISIPQAHSHLPVSEIERDLWLECMAAAISEQGYPSAFGAYLLKQLAIPAERIRVLAQNERA